MELTAYSAYTPAGTDLDLFWHHVNGAERWPNFRPGELACKHCQALRVNYYALDTLQKFRNLLGRPVVLNSAYRCADHNQAVGGAPASYHLSGRAFDTQTFATNRGQFHLTRLAAEAGFRGFGYYDHFTHLDVGPRRDWFAGDLYAEDQ